MFSGHTHNLDRATNYAQALKLFNTTPKPRGAKWETYQRPLGNNRQHHYRIESLKPDEYIDVVLYSKVLARYYAPDVEGNERRLFASYNTLTSRKFLWDVIGMSEGSAALAADGRRVVTPVYVPHCVTDHTDDFSADFWYNKDHRILTDRSRHTKHWRKVTTDDDKFTRRQVTRVFEPFITMAIMRMPEFIENTVLQRHLGQPFSSVGTGWKHANMIKEMNTHLAGGLEVTTAQTEQFFDMCFRVFNTLASRRAYNQTTNPRHRPEYADLEQPITGDEFRKSILYTLNRILSTNVRSGREEIPQFVAMNDYPRSNIFVTEAVI